MKLASRSNLIALTAMPFLFAACTVTLGEGDSEDAGSRSGSSSENSTTEPDATPSGEDSGAGSNTAAEMSGEPSSEESDGGSASATTDDAASSTAEGADAGSENNSETANSDGDSGMAAETSDSGSNSDGTGAAGETRFGTIALSQSLTVIAGLPDPFVSASAFASFTISAAPSTAAATPECSTETIGSCTMQQCELLDIPNTEAGPAPVSVSAGALTFGGLDGDPALAFDETTGIYIGTLSTEFFWAKAQEVRVEAAGSEDVPGFSISLLLPDAVTLTAPTADAASAFSIARNEDLSVTWDGGGEGMVSVSLSGSTEDDSVSITCFVPSADGGVTVDEALLGALPDAGAFSVSASGSAVTDAGDSWMISFSGTNSAAAGTAAFSD